jgi:hypothetical protein
VLASLAASRSDSLRGDGHGPLDALVGGYHVAFLVGAIFAVAAAAIGAGLLRTGPQQAHDGSRASGVPADVRS